MPYRDISIRWKIVTVTMLVSALALLVASAAFTLYDQFSYRERLVSMIRTQAQTVGINCRAALAFDDPKAGEETLSAFRSNTAIREATLYNHSGRRFAGYLAKHAEPRSPATPGPDEVRIEGRRLELFAPILLEDARVGTLYVQGDLSEVYERGWLYAGIAGLVLLGAALVAFVLATRMERLISGPILAVAQVSRKIAETKDYSARVPIRGNDEIGVLGSDFNAMLERIGAQTMEIRRREEMLLSLANNLPGVVYRFYVRADGARGFYYVSDRVWDILGLKPDLPGLFNAFSERVHPEDRGPFLALVDEAVRLGNAWSFEGRFLRDDGQTLWFQTRATPVRAATEVVFNGILLDISDAKRTQLELRRLSAVIEQTEDEILITDPDARVLYVNPAFERVTGYALGEIVGQTPKFLQSGKHDRDFYTALRHILCTGGNWSGLLTNRCKDGRLIEEEVFIGPLLAPNGKPEGYFSVRRDVTGKKQLEDRLRRSQRLESIGRLAGGVAHDFNNLLVPVLGFSELLMHDLPQDDPSRARLEVIHKAALRARKLTQQLLAFGRKTVLEMTQVDLSDLVREFEAMLRRVLREDIALDLRLAEGLDPIKADVFQIEQILMNLLANARDAMPNGGKVTIETRNVLLDEDACRELAGAYPGPHVMLTVTDTGLGMSTEVQGRLFEPFFTTKEVGQGTGLGLATVFGIVQQHSGCISVLSEVGKGTSFRVFFPRVEEMVQASDVLPMPASASTGNETILLVEDDRVVRELAELVLRQYGYTVCSAATPNAALDFLKTMEMPIHLLLTDVIMPGMNGKELYHEIKVRRPDIRVLFISGYTNDVIARHGVLEEGLHFLQKPFTVELLIRAVREALDAPVPPPAHS